MPLGSQVNIDTATSGTPQALASETISTKQYQGVLVCDASGNVQGSSANPVFTSEADNVFGPFSLTAADAASTSVAGAGGQSVITGTPTANSAASASFTGEASFAVQVTGTFVATYQFERSLDGGTTWTAVSAFAAGTIQAGASWTLPGMFHGNASSATNIRVRVTSFTSGTLSVRMLAGAGTGTITVGNPTRLTGPDFAGQVGVKAASTSAAAADGALVVAPSPNTPLPSGANTIGGVTLPDVVPAAQTVDMTTVGAAATFGVAGYTTLSAQLSGTFTGTLTLEGTVDGTNWVAAPGVSQSGFRSLTMGSGSVVFVPCAGFVQVRLRVAVAGTGTATVTVREAAGESASRILEPVSAKGSQATNAIQIQQMRDTGRTPVLIYAEAAAGNAADALVSLVKVTGNTTAAAATSISPTSGKTLRITEMMVSLVSTGTAVINVRLRGRYNPSGAALLTSAVQAINQRIGFLSAPVAGSVLNPAVVDLIEGLEIPSGAGFGLSQVGSANSYTLDVAFFGYEY